MRRSTVFLGLILLMLVGSAFGQEAEREAMMRARLVAAQAQAQTQMQVQRALIHAQAAQVQVQVRPAGPRVVEEAVDVVEDVPDAEAEQEAAPDPQPAPAATPEANFPPGTLRFYLMDGSVLTGTLAVDTLPINTEFGDLVVPIEAIERFAPGLQSHPDLAKQISGLIEQLGHEDAGRRDAAQAQLISFGPGLIEELRANMDTPDAERKLRLEAVLEALYEQQMDPMLLGAGQPSAQPSLIRLDEIETEAFTMAGQITQEQFEIKSKFGTLNVALGDIMVAERITSTLPEIRRSIEVQGTDIAGINYKNTGIRLNRGDRVIIQADGQITMTPWGRNTVTGPDGMPNNGMYNGQIPFGALCGRIGDAGTEMMIGSRSNFTVERPGVLYLGFAMQANWAQQQFPGTYNVRIRVIPGGQ
jgi:hypothetical protein